VVVVVVVFPGRKHHVGRDVAKSAFPAKPDQAVSRPTRCSVPGIGHSSLPAAGIYDRAIRKGEVAASLAPVLFTDARVVIGNFIKRIWQWRSRSRSRFQFFLRAFQSNNCVYSILIYLEYLLRAFASFRWRLRLYSCFEVMSAFVKFNTSEINLFIDNQNVCACARKILIG
jgi:hypothetical protein